MSTLAEIQRYRELAHARDTGGCLDIADVLALEELEERVRNSIALTAPGTTHHASLSQGEIDVHVLVTRLDIDGLVCTNAPYVAPGTMLSLAIADDEDSRTYRFRVRVAWTRRVPLGEFELGLTLGAPAVVLRWGLGRRAADTVIELEQNLKPAA